MYHKTYRSSSNDAAGDNYELSYLPEPSYRALDELEILRMESAEAQVLT